MSDLKHREQLELHLKAELEEAQRRLRDATPDEIGEAHQRYRHALRTFARLVVDGINPED